MYTITELLAEPLRVFPQLWDTRALSTCIENNEWHVEEDVLQHTYAVMAAIPAVVRSQAPNLATLAECESIVLAYTEQIVALGYSRLDLLRVAALFHDIGKPGTLQVDESGRTKCPGHAKESERLLRKIAGLVDLEDECLDYVGAIVELHHTPDAYTEALDTSEATRRRREFLRSAGHLGADLLLFYLADYEGSKAAPEIEDLKARIYPEVASEICKLLRTEVTPT